MSNLLEETLENLKENSKTADDVLWVGSRDGQWATDWNNFEKIANREYDSGYGSAEVHESLVVVGADWWLERHEYDGSEWWEFKQTPIKSVKAKEINNVFVVEYDQVWVVERPQPSEERK